jgi:multicomponent Na+:H+ antiporter subunit B
VSADRRDGDPEVPGLGDSDTTVIARTVARVAFPLILLTAVALLLQGHNRPGGGFIAGVLTAAGVGLVYIIYGLDYLQTELLHHQVFPDASGLGVGREYVGVFSAGLLLAAASGFAAIVLGYPFLTQAVVFLEHLPVYGELELASAFAFDLGVFVVVVGSLLTLLAVVGDE